MLDTVNGLPVHPLVVHAVVVLLPLAAIGVIALAVRPAWRARYGLLVVVAALLSVAAIPLATQSGESLEHHVGDPGKHAELGDTLIWFAIPLLAVAVGLVWLDRRARRTTTGPSDGPGAAQPVRRPAALYVVIPVLAVLVSVANMVQVYRIGDSGARAAWGNTASQNANAGK